MMVVKGFFWNYRGIKKMVAPYVKEMLRSLNPEFACFQETILSNFLEACLRKIDPGKCYLWDWIPAKGKSGGCSLASRWKGLMLELGGRGVYSSSHNMG
jgi:hypothetical protein